MKKSNKIVLAQINTIVGNVRYNKEKIIENIKTALVKQADLIVFPELCLLSYPIGDILGRYPKLALQCAQALDEIREYCEDITALVGFPEINNSKFGKPYYNSIALIQNKKIIKIIRKSLLPNYAEHNEYRYFEPAEVDIESRIFELNGVKFGVIICEDAWNDFEFFEKNLYKIDPVKEIAPFADVLICPAASPTRAKKEQLKHNMMKYCAKKYNVKYIYVNQVGAQDELVYDGLSRMYDEKGELCAMARGFEEDNFLIYLDFCDDSSLAKNSGSKTDSCADKTKKVQNIINPLPKGLELTLNSQKEFSLDHYPDLERTYLALKLAISDYFSKNGFKRAVLGLSGGLDSTICAVLLADSLGVENVYGISMPSKLTSDESKNDAKKLANNLGINFLEIPIKQMQDCTTSKFDEVFKNVEKSWNDKYSQSFTQDNIQARSRAMILWGIANEFPSTLPVATSDKSELYMGYATINGDMSGGFAPVCDVVKTKLFALARWMNENRAVKNAIPVSIIQKPPGAELAINPETGKALLAEEALMPYEFLDEVIWRIENFNQSINDMMKVEFLYEKRNNINCDIKIKWLEKFFKRLNTALYKWYIIPPGPIIDSRSINKAEFRQSIISNIDYN